MTASAIGERATFVRLDVTQEADWANAFATANAAGPLRGLVNNAGLFQPKPLIETDRSSFDAHVAVNQLGPYLGMEAAIEPMRAVGGSSIVNISSVAGLRGVPGAFAYTTSKWALRGMTKAAALDLAAYNIRINSVHPGPIDAEMLTVRPPEHRKRRLKQVPMRRMGTSEEVARLIMFLLSEEGSYMTGAEISVDGGVSL